MRLFADIEKTIERRMRQWTERLLGRADSDQLLLVHRGILEDVEAHIQTVQRGRRVLPYNQLTVRLASPDPDRRALYAMAFEQEGRLESDLRQSLEAAGCECPAGFAVTVAVLEEGSRAFEIDYALRAKETAAAAPAAASVAARGPGRLVVTRGKARQDEYRLTRARTMIGRMEELTDHEQRVVRRNDIVFEEGADEANGTVSRSHAHIRLDPSTGECRLADDGSEFGTRIFRDGRPLEVPGGNRRGIALRPGDEIYLGRACLRFEAAE